MKLDVLKKFVSARKAMSNALIERDEEIDLVLTALIANENPLLIGPPGTAKSFLIDSLMTWMGSSVNKFSILFNRFTVPEEVFGPISLKGMKEDVYRRVPTARLQEAHLAFGDEIFKASTAVLGTILKALNEHTYEDGGKTIKIPLVMFLAASNEGPQDGELGALFDRFLFRKVVRPIQTRAGQERLLKGALNNRLTPNFDGETITIEEIQAARRGSRGIPFTSQAWEALLEILRSLRREGIRPGDRRQMKAVYAVQAFTFLNGDFEVEPQHLSILSHVLWDQLEGQPEKCAQIVGKIAHPETMAINDALVQAESAFEGVGSKYEDIAAKLDSLMRQLKGMKQSPKRDAALAQIGSLREENLQRILGLDVSK